jgi:hypothetical protein
MNIHHTSMCIHTYIQEQIYNAKSHIPSPRPLTTVERKIPSAVEDVANDDTFQKKENQR